MKMVRVFFSISTKQHGFKSGLKANQSKTIIFWTKSHCFVVCMLWIEECGAEIFTQDRLRCHQIKVDVTLSLLILCKILFPKRKCQSGLAIKSNRHPNHQKLTALPSIETSTWLLPEVMPVAIAIIRTIQIERIFVTEYYRELFVPVLHVL